MFVVEFLPGDKPSLVEGEYQIVDLDQLTWEDFSGHVGTSFGVALEEGAAAQQELELTSSQKLREAPTGFPREPFSLIFEGPSDRLLEQNTYWLSHPHMGEFGIFIVPIAQKGDRIRYEAVFG